MKLWNLASIRSEDVVSVTSTKGKLGVLGQMSEDSTGDFDTE